MDSQLFRHSALERLSSPERLDAMMTVTAPRAWLGLVALCGALGGALVWGFVGRTHDTVEGGGILLRTGGLFEVQAVGSGLIANIMVKTGDVLEPGQIVAHLAQPELERSIVQSEARLKDLRAQGAQSGGFITVNRELEITAVDQQLREIDRAQRDARDQLAYLQERLKLQEDAVRDGLITRDVANATSQEISRTRESIGGMDAQRTQLAARVQALRNQAAQNLFSLETQIQTEAHQLDLLRLQLERTATIRSPYRARVVEVLADSGNVVQAGQPVVAVELQNQELDGFVFVPLSGKQIQPGMRVRITPAGVKWEEFGYMLGTVRSVSAAPLSPAAMNVYLRNSTLVQQFNAQGGAYLVQVDVEEDRTTRSGFSWTSRGGPPLDLGSGTLLTASITLRDQRPITLVIPTLRRWLGV